MRIGSKPDDSEAVRSLADTLQPFDSEDRERIIRWAREKLGMTARKPAEGFHHERGSADP